MWCAFVRRGEGGGFYLITKWVSPRIEEGNVGIAGGERKARMEGGRERELREGDFFHHTFPPFFRTERALLATKRTRTNQPPRDRSRVIPPFPPGKCVCSALQRAVMMMMSRCDGFDSWTSISGRSRGTYSTYTRIHLYSHYVL